jgi:hypothetical protein
MNKISNNENGFTFVEVLLVVLTLLIVGGAGFLVAKHIDSKKTVATTIASVTSATNKPATVNTAPTKPVDPYTGWLTYVDKGYVLASGVSIKYPSDWQVKVGDSHAFA